MQRGGRAVVPVLGGVEEARLVVGDPVVVSWTSQRGPEKEGGQMQVKLSEPNVGWHVPWRHGRSLHLSLTAIFHPSV